MTESHMFSSAALLLTSSEAAIDLDLKLTALSHRYCPAENHVARTVICTCEQPTQRELDYRLTLRDQAMKQLLPVLVEVLNMHHGENFRETEWLLMCGHWLERFVMAFVQRFRDVERLLNQSRYQFLVTNERSLPLPIATSSSGSALVFNSEIWDQYVIETILDSFPEAPKEKIRIDAQTRAKAAPDNNAVLHAALRNRLLDLANLFTKITSKRSKTLILASYLPRAFEFKFHISLRQLPQFWKTRFAEISHSADLALRRQLSEKLETSLMPDVSSLTRLIGAELLANLPISFLEGFHILPKQALQRGLPLKPSVIFTSNAFDEDDTFKRYVVDHKRMSARYVVGQHGNNYGTLKSMSPSIEERTSDAFITWGWTAGLDSQKSGFILKLAGMRSRRRKSQRYLLMQLHRENAYGLADAFLNHERYFSSQINFANSLDDSVLQNMFIRLHPSTESVGWGERQKWHQKLRLQPQFSKNTRHVYEDFRTSKLVIHSYDSTGLLECLALNIPTVAFWSGGLDCLTDSSKRYYEMLISVGVIHLDSMSLSRHINALGNHVDSWWYSESVQSARRDFCSQFANLSQTPIQDLTRLLVDKG